MYGGLCYSICWYTEISAILRKLQLYEFTDEIQLNSIKTFVPFYVDDNKKNTSITNIFETYLLLLCVVFGSSINKSLTFV